MHKKQWEAELNEKRAKKNEFKTNRGKPRKNTNKIVDIKVLGNSRQQYQDSSSDDSD